MIVEILVDFQLKSVDGQAFQYKVGDSVSFSDDVAKKLIAKGRVRQIASPPVQYKSRILGK